MAAYSFLTLDNRQHEPELFADTLSEIERQLRIREMPLGDLQSVPGAVVRSLGTRIWGSTLRPARTHPRRLGMRELKLLSDLSLRDSPATVVGVLDLGAYFPAQQLMRYPNAEYPDFVLLEVFAAVPAGMVKQLPFLERWAAQRGGLVYGSRMPPSSAVSSVEFHRMAEVLRTQLQLDHLIGTTHVGIASERLDGVRAGLLNDVLEHTCLQSTIGFRDIAEVRGWSFPRAIRPWLESRFDSIRHDRLRSGREK